MKKTLTTIFCLSVLFMGTQSVMAANTKNAKISLFEAIILESLDFIIVYC